MSDKIELLPCPFCGETLRINNASLAVHSRDSVCLLRQQPVVVDDPQQVDRWNRRAAIAQQPAPVAVPDEFPLAFVTTESGGGNHKLVLSFGSIGDMQEWYKKILTILSEVPAAPVAVQGPPLTWGAYVNGDLITGSRNYVQRERDEYETTCLDDPDFVHEEAFPLYTTPPVAEQSEKRLCKPAKVGAVRFNAGVPERLVIESAQRAYEYDVTPEKEAKRIAKYDAMRSELMSAVVNFHTSEQQDTVKVPRELLERSAYLLETLDEDGTTHGELRSLLGKE